MFGAAVIGIPSRVMYSLGCVPDETSDSGLDVGSTTTSDRRSPRAAVNLISLTCWRDCQTRRSRWKIFIFIIHGEDILKGRALLRRIPKRRTRYRIQRINSVCVSIYRIMERILYVDDIRHSTINISPRRFCIFF